MIRRATLADTDAITSLNGELGYSTAPDEMRQRLDNVLAAPEQVVFVAEEAGDAVGWIHVAIVENLETNRFAEIRGLIVTAARRGGGIGAQLVAAAEQCAQQQGVARIRVRSNITRDRARRFYERLGYTVTKTQNVFDRTLASRRAASTNKSGGRLGRPIVYYSDEVDAYCSSSKSASDNASSSSVSGLSRSSSEG